MLDPRHLSDDDILDYIDEGSFTRGQAYANEGRIISPRRQGNTLKALCRGSIPEPYRVQATLAEDGRILEAECSCPVGYGGHCKHVAALLLTWRSEPERFVEVQDLATALEGKSKEELVRLLLTVAGVDPAIEQLLEIVAVGGDPVLPSAEFYQDQVAATLGYAERPWESWDAFGAGGRLGSLLAQGQALAEQGDWRGAAEVYRGLLAGALESDAFAYDEDGGMAELANKCVAGLGRSLAEIDDPAARQAIIETLWDVMIYDFIELGGLGLADDVPVILVERTTPEEREPIIERLRAALEGADSEWTQRVYSDLLAEFEAEQLEGEAYLDRLRELGLTERLVERLLELGRIDEALQTAEDAEPDDLDMVARAFDRHGHGDLIEPLAARRIEEGVVDQYYGTGINLRAWLKNRYLARGDFAAALPLAEQEFRSAPTIERYRQVRDLAQATGRWAELRPDLLAMLAEDQPALKIQIHLEEGELDAALAGVRELDLSSPYSYPYHSLRLWVAEAVAEEQPEAALEIYLKIADELIDERGRDNYATAATLLVHARDLFDRLGRYEEWEQHIAKLRADHSRLRALREELDRAEL